MTLYKFSYVHFLSSNFLVFLILLSPLVFLKILDFSIYLLFLSISMFVFSTTIKDLIIKNEGLILNYKRSKKDKVLFFEEIKSIHVIHKDYYVFQTKAIELKFHSNEKIFRINCNAIIEKNEYEDAMLHLYLFLKEKFQDTYFVEYDLLKF